jgi:phytoene synthase
VEAGDLAVSRDTSFYYAFLVLPPRKRRAIVAVWDLCRAVDDTVDEALPDAHMHGALPADASAKTAAQLGAWRAEISALFDGRPGTPQGRALQPFVREFNLPRARFEELVDGVEMDLARSRYATFDELLEYCRRVASAVGLICVEIFGYRDERTRDYAETLGVALQLTNIIRDVAADARLGRIYLPAEDLARFDVADDALCRGERTPQVAALLRFECERAHRYFERAAAQLPIVDARRMAAAEIMSAIYHEILRRIERADYDVFSRRIRVPRPHRAMLAARIWLRTWIGLTRT